MNFAPLPGPAQPNILLYGPPKTGKTAGACTAPGTKLLFNLDLPNATRYARKRDPSIREPQIPAFEMGKTPILDLMAEISNEVWKPKQTLGEVVIVDPLSELYRLLLDELSRRSMKPTFDHRLAVTTHIERFVISLCKAPVAAIFVAHELPVKDESTETFERLPFTGTSNTNLGGKIMGKVDIIGYTGVDRDSDGRRRYLAQLEIAKGRRGGDRFDCLLEGEETYRELNLTEWFALINQSDPVSTLTQKAAA